MEGYTFHEGQIPSGYSFEFEESLFNQQAYCLLQSPYGWHSFYILNHERKVISASIHFNLSETIATSPLRSPFGSIEFSDTLPPDILFEFLIFFEKSLKEKGVTSIIIKNCPQAYQPGHAAVLQTFLFNLHYKVVNAEIGSFLPVTSLPAENNFNYSKKKVLEKAREAGFVVRTMEISDLDIVYSFIQKHHSEKEYPLSIGLNLRRYVNKFAQRYVLFGVFQNETLMAAAIAIKVREHILFDFKHDHSPAADQWSPVVMLIAGMYHYCRQHNIAILDLGTSALNGLPNFSLLHFKKFLGGKPSPKLTFEKSID